MVPTTATVVPNGFLPGRDIATREALGRYVASCNAVRQSPSLWWPWILAAFVFPPAGLLSHAIVGEVEGFGAALEALVGSRHGTTKLIGSHRPDTRSVPIRGGRHF
jgi:hypothetical protein